MDRRIEGIHLGIGHVVWMYEGFLTDGTDEGKGGVKHDSGLGGTVDVLVGVAEGDGTDSFGKASTHSADGKWDEKQEA